jgi:putative transposase
MERVIERTFKVRPIRIVTYCLMPTHWHMVLWPEKDGELSEFMRLLSVTHAQRRHAFMGTAGTGPIYQGRFKSFPVQQDDHFLTVCRYVERNALRANLVRSAARWMWGGLAKRGSESAPPWLLPVAQWPVDVPSDWSAWVNRAETGAELTALRLCVKRGMPFGDERWRHRTAERLGLRSTLRPRGRQRVRETEVAQKD